MTIVNRSILENRVSGLLPVVQCVIKAALGQSLDNDTFPAMVDLAEAALDVVPSDDTFPAMVDLSEAAVDVVPSDTENLGLRAAIKDHFPHLFHAAKWNHKPKADGIVGIKIREFSQRILSY